MNYPNAYSIFQKYFITCNVLGYLLVTVHLPLALEVGGSLNVDKMSSTHPNSIFSVAMSYMRKKDDMGKYPF